jgi:ATP-dependent Clp protease ATP-binding subunit ClpC
MDDGRLTDGEGRTVDFTNTVLVMTSNLGASRSRRPIGFTAAEPAADDDRMLAAAREAFLPEFLNRIDETVTFHPLTREHVQRITAAIIDRVAERLRTEREIELTVDEALVAQLAQDGFDDQFGARPLQRHVRRTLERELTAAIVRGELPDRSRVHAHADEHGAIELQVAEAEALAVR